MQNHSRNTTSSITHNQLIVALDEVVFPLLFCILLHLYIYLKTPGKPCLKIKEVQNLVYYCIAQCFSNWVPRNPGFPQMVVGGSERRKCVIAEEFRWQS